MEPIIAWPEGKWRSAEYLLERFPKDFFMLIDPFCGALSIPLAVHNHFDNDIAYRISDNNKDLIRAHQTLMQDTDELLSELSAMILEWSYYDTKEKKKFYFARRAEYNRRLSGPIRSAALFFFLCRTCFNGLWRKNRNDEMNTPIGDMSRISSLVINLDNMKDIAKFLNHNNVSYMHSDFRLSLARVIERATLGYEEQFVFLDPPRYELGSDRFRWEDRVELENLMQIMHEAGVKWMLIDRDDDVTVNLYATWNINFITKSKSSELMVTNYEVFCE